MFGKRKAEKDLYRVTAWKKAKLCHEVVEAVAQENSDKVKENLLKEMIK